MNKPTEAQIKEFWEWYGYTGKLESIEDIGEREGKLVYVSPPIDLNNLFKYAVPKAIEVIRTKMFKNISLERAREALLMFWLKEWNKSGELVLSLFWVLWQVKEKGK